ncbi:MULTISPECIES: thiamine ABC transporter ATP-binding protein [Pacificibacter]|uniref:thiamine ABC transporter ATP-binding protein n=1 Tax=Pacificibacter TaxID=1042323 RepID=UPI001C082D4B|nr:MULTISPECIES: ATP-binding cassette domain-containing protein [Pacificibacter]MBU2936055.1 ATP-binding cassette domain-containing protein [Pacificibacter marinus]MDO6615096.1 ATP-binding cassette domain-containing protein [Pacificibacter sp. 1_MG-2023]
MLSLEGAVIAQDGFTLKADFRVKAGRRVAVLGPSGAGKSTLLAAIGGYVTVTQGDIVWDGRSISNLQPNQRPVSNVFQDNNLFPHMTALQNVGLGINPNLRLNAADKQRVLDALIAVGLSGMEDRLPAALSGGQQSRVALARLLVQQKQLVLLDEPFSALGPAMRIEMADLAQAVGARIGATVMMVSHDIKDVERFAEDVLWVEDGICHLPRALGDFLKDPPAGFTSYVGE